MAALTIDSTTTAFITLPEVMRQANALNLDSGNAAELDLFREAAQDVVESIIGPVLWRTITEQVPVAEATYAYVTGGMASLTYAPVVSVQSVAVVGTPAATLTYALDRDSGLLTGIQPWTWTFSRNLTVAYTAGRTSCPSAVRVAALIIATHLWQTQLGNAPSSGLFDNEQKLDVAEFSVGYAIPNRAVELLAPYRTSTVLIA